MKKKLSLLLYLVLLRYLPATDRRLPGGGWLRRLRSGIAGRCLDGAGRNVNVERMADFGAGRGITLGDDFGLGVRCRVRGPLVIGRNVMMGPDVIIFGPSHRHDRTDIPMQQQGDEPARLTTVGDDVWIGSRAIIMNGVSIGRGSIIGANAVVTRDVPPYSVAAGIPARVVKSRLGAAAEGK